MKHTFKFSLLLLTLPFVSACAPSVSNQQNQSHSGLNPTISNQVDLPRMLTPSVNGAPTFRQARLQPAAKPRIRELPRLETLNGDPGDQQQLELVAKINKTRQQRGLKALTIDQSLMDAAQNYAQTLSSIGDIAHIGPAGDKPGDRARASGYNWGFIAENLASGQDSPTLTVSDWMKSPSHRDALLHVDPIHIGVGHVTNPNDPNYKEYWVMLVGTPL